MNQRKKVVTVLLADDDPNDQTKMKMALNGSIPELRIDLVHNGMQLIDYLVKHYTSKKKSLPDIIITDLYMPFAGGLHVLKQIRKREEFKHIPIYVFSANFDRTIQSRVLENGATEFHQKPGDFNSLQSIVNDIVSRTQTALATA